ncbi:hypothetical protein ASF52_10320 [Methylobacterium sp. Leaf112]|nr:hypothetical protein ASF52_10320 [Methylobacterium sp. Leaf112]
MQAPVVSARRGSRKWRPTLGLVVLTMLATVAALPLLGLSFVRLYENQLVRQTEGELIAQSAVVAAFVARDLETDPARADLLGAAAPDASLPIIEPALDLTVDHSLDRRPDAQEAAKAASPTALALGERLAPVLARVKATTLAGFRIVDRDGTIIAGGDEVGRSLAGVEEVADALRGRFRAVLRARVSKHAVPPLYSLSRGTSVRVFTALPILVDGRVAGAVYASRTPNNVMRQLYGEGGKVATAVLVVLVATLGIALVFTRAIARPIHALVARAVALGQGAPVDPDPDARFGTREIALLGLSLDAMALQLRERSDYVATFASHVSHELKTPLTAIRGAAELLRDDGLEPGAAMSAAERRRFLDNIVADTARLSALLGRLRELARAERPGAVGIASLAAIVSDLRLRFPDLDVRTENADAWTLGLSDEKAGIVFGHLADNATRHGAAVLQITARATAGHLHVHVVDDGTGIAERDRARVLEPFFTTRRVEGGTGMGLGIVQAVLRAQGGTLELAAAGGVSSLGGARFEITLPLAREGETEHA